MNLHRIIAIFMFSLSARAMAQDPYTVTRVFWLEGTTLTSTDVETQASSSIEFGVDVLPDFVSFGGMAFDRPRDRVVLYTNHFDGTDYFGRIVAVDADLDPGTGRVIRNQLPFLETDEATTGALDVDPATGRIFWYQDGQIRSIGQAGIGVPVVAAGNVPAPGVLKVDVAHGTYVMLEKTTLIPDLMLGQLDGVGAAAPITIPYVLEQHTSLSYTDFSIEPISGDIYWSEWGSDPNEPLEGDAAAVFRVPFDDPLSTPELMLGTSEGSFSPKPRFWGVDVYADQLVASMYSLSWPDFQNFELYIKNTTTSELTIQAFPSIPIDLEIDYYVAPIIVQPEPALVDSGDVATLQVVPSDDESEFQWKRNGTPVVDDARISGATSSTLTFNTAMVNDTDSYTCTVITTLGDEQTSNEVIFAVRGSTDPVCVADLNDDGELNFFDVSVFLSAFSAGCP